MQEAEFQGKHLIFFTGPSPQYKANAAVLVGIFQVMLLQRSPEKACNLLHTMEPFLPFRDPSRGPSCFDLTVYDCVRGIAKAKEVGFLDWHLPECTFNLAEYEHYEQVENGDLNWIVPGKLLAFSGPSASPYMIGTYTTHTPEDYHKYFTHKGITAVVRLNNKLYDGARFSSAGFNMHELFFSDGSCPSENILQTFLQVAETEKGALAVHCKAGLGRTGVLICAYMIKHYGFTAEEAMGYIRICRPGSVIGPQQNYLIAKAKQLAAEGRAVREATRAACAEEARRARAASLAEKSGQQQRISISATCISSQPVAPPAPVSASPDRPAAAPSKQQSARLARMSSGGTKDMSLDGGCASEDSCGPSPSSHGTSSTATSGRISNFLRGRAASLRVTTGRPTPPAVCRTRSLLAAASAAASKSGSTTPTRRKAAEAAASPTDLTQLKGVQKGVARMLAPNGQPRKLPAAVLAAGNQEALRHFTEEEEVGAADTRQGWTISSATRSRLNSQNST
ncbi:g6671 [Coccomyxa elongata]